MEKSIASDLGKKIEKEIAKLLRYRIHISIIYYFLLTQAWQKLGKSHIDFFVIISFTLWHFGLYLFDRAYDAEKDLLSQKEEAIPLKQRKTLIVISIFLTLIPLALLYLKNTSMTPYILYLPLAYLYTYPLPGFNKRARDIFLLKNFYSSFFIWTFSIFYILKNYANCPEIGYNFYFENFGALLILTTIGEIHWDMRDIETDKANHAKTLPVVLGLNNSKIILVLALLVSYFYLNIVSTFSLVMMFSLVLLAGYKVSNILYHLPPLIALYNFIVKA